MLSDRSYTKNRLADDESAVPLWLISAIIAGFLTKLFFSISLGSINPDLINGFAVSVSGMKALHFWALATYPLLHSTDNLLQIIGVLVGLALLGRELVPITGGSRFLALFFGSAVAGALAWLAANWSRGGFLMGGTAGLYGLIVLYSCLNPNLQLRFLLFFVFPVTFTPRQLTWGLATLDLAGCLFYEIFRAASPFAYAPSAHLGGMLCGFIYYRFKYRRTTDSAVGNSATPKGRTTDFISSGPAGSVKPIIPPISKTVSRREELRRDLDRILDKINSTGLPSLSNAERLRLAEAKDLLSKD